MTAGNKSFRPRILAGALSALFLLIHGYAVSAAAQDPPDTILVFHPTVHNIDMMHSLTSNGTFPLENYHFKGIYHAKERYDYAQSEAHISGADPDLPFSLEEVAHCFTDGDIYREHPATPVFKRLFENSTGVILLGGPDLPPATYGESMHLVTSVTDPWRHYLELSFVFHLLGGLQDPGYQGWLELRSDYAVLGICLGMQTLNAGTGGTLIQDIPMEVYDLDNRAAILESVPEDKHRNYHFDDPALPPDQTGYHVHPLVIETGRWPFDLPGLPDIGTAWVLSSHHQAIETTGKGLLPIALSSDGKIIEAVAHSDYGAVLGVQFHPEKPDIFDPDAINHVHPDSTINFHRYLDDKGSLGFHYAFWKGVAGLFNQ